MNTSLAPGGMKMNRRNFFNTGAKVAIGATVLSGLNANKAEAAEENEVMADISRNHGHNLTLTMSELVAVLRKLQPEELTETIDIQGESGHPHSIDLNFDKVLSVLLGEEVTVESTEDFGHTHVVNIKLEL